MIAKKILSQYQPTIITVAGSWGKTMTISTATNVLSDLRFHVSPDTALTLSDSLTSVKGFSFPMGLLSTVMKKDYPQLLFIELKEKKQMDKELLDLAENKILIIPFLSQYEIQEYGGVEKYLQKQCAISKSRAKTTTIIYNQDIVGMQEVVDSYEWGRKLSFSVTSDLADFKSLNLEYKIADDAHITNDHRVQGMSFKVKNGGATLPLRLAKSVGPQHVYSTLATLLLARALDLNILDILSSIRDGHVLPGRMKLVPGIKKTMILDDTYDIDAETAYTTFQVGSQLPLEEGKQRIAVIGEMYKHGKDSEQAHCLLGDELAGLNYDAIIGIGERSHDILRCALDAGMEESQLFHFMDQEDAGKFIQHELKQGDLVIIKGSQQMKLESIVKELMAFPLKAKEEILQR